MVSSLLVVNNGGFLVLLSVLLHIAVATASRHQITSGLFTVFQNIISEIRPTFPHCSIFNYIFESNSAYFNEDETALQDFIREDFAAGLILDLGTTANSADPSLLFYSESRYFFRYHQPCSVILFELGPSLMDNAAHLNNGTVGRRWPEKLLPLLPNNVQNSFFLFFTNEANADSSTLESKTNQVMHETAMILHAVFIISLSSRDINVFKGLPRASEGSWNVVATYCSGVFETLLDKKLFYKMYMNFNGQSVVTTACLVCKFDEESYRLTGVPRSSFGMSWFDVQDKFNMTKELEEVFGVPNNGIQLNDDGELEYDGFHLPLVEGTAAISTLLIPSPIVFHTVYFSRPYIYDAMCFVIGLPKIHNQESIAVLQEPLEDQVWLGFVISFYSIVVFAQIMMACRGDKRGLQLAVAAVFRPILDQSVSFGHRINSNGFRTLFGVWLFSLIVLGSGYKSKLISAIVVPHYDYPPLTFADLANSEYKLGGVYFQAIAHDLTVSNSTRNLQLLKKMTEIDFMQPTCYRNIFHGKQACVGYSITFNMNGMKYLVDIKGRDMFLKSRDTLFGGFVVAAFSKFYPMIVEPFNYYLGCLEQAGIALYLNRADLAHTKRLGKMIARKVVDTLTYYKGADSNEGGVSNDRRVVVVVIKILKIGTSISVFVFLLEILVMLVFTVIEAYKESRAPARRRSRRNKITKVKKVIQPMAYENEFYYHCKRETSQSNAFVPSYYR